MHAHFSRKTNFNACIQLPLQRNSNSTQLNSRRCAVAVRSNHGQLSTLRFDLVHPALRFLSALFHVATVQPSSRGDKQITDWSLIQVSVKQQPSKATTKRGSCGWQPVGSHCSSLSSSAYCRPKGESGKFMLIKPFFPQ
jgi:hypothetical protein